MVYALDPTSIPTDPLLPLLKEVLSTEIMAEAFRKHLLKSGSDLVLSDCRIERVKYKPGKNCLVCYRLTLEDKSQGRLIQQIVSGRTYNPGGSMARFVKANLDPVLDTPMGPPARIPELEMVLWPFPNDRKLKHLTTLMDPEKLERRCIQPLVKTYWGDGWAITGIEPALVHYVPEHTTSMRVAVRLENPVTGQEASWVIYGKTYYDDQGATSERVMTRLYDSGASHGLITARPLGYQEAFKVHWQQALPGQPISGIDMTSGHFLTLLEEAARMVAALHSEEVDTQAAMNVGTVEEKLAQVRRQINYLLPFMDETLSNQNSLLLSQARKLVKQPDVTLHGDLHLKNILADGQQVALIDLDGVKKGSPLFDIGSFIAGLIYRARQMEQPWPPVARAIDTFLAAYEEEVPWKVTRDDVNWHVATALIYERVYRCLARMKPGRMELIDDLISYSVCLANGARPWER